MKIIITSGYFDPIHVGHIELLKLSKQLGDKLVVICSRDEQCIWKKGKAFMPEQERKIILESLKFVDEVFMSVDKDKSCIESIRAIAEKYKGNEIIFTKGGDRRIDEIPETPICNELGVEIIEGLGAKIQSSSDLTGIK
jgi:cytidyltransferase-like protein